MKSKLQQIGILAIGAVLIAGAPAWAGEESTWVTEDEHVISLSGDHAVSLSGDADVFDLSDLLEGETRTFGAGDRQVTVTRDGDVVTIDRGGADGKLEILCHVDTDTCRVMTFGDDPDKVMIMVKKIRQCVNGVGDCEPAVEASVSDLNWTGTRAIIRKVKCDDQGNCEEFEDVHAGDGEVEIIADIQRSGHGNVMILRSDELGGDRVLLRCPEGDATIRVDREEAEDTFLCPKHSLPMQKAPAKLIRKIRVEEDD